MFSSYNGLCVEAHFPPSDFVTFVNGVLNNGVVTEKTKMFKKTLFK